jgi:hypothetical protein
MKMQLSNGLVVEGSLQNILDVIHALHLPDRLPVYQSETQGPIVIAAMETTHIKNAILKKIRNWSPSGSFDSEVVKILQTSPLQDDLEFQDLRAEFLRRMRENTTAVKQYEKNDTWLTNINIETLKSKLRNQ